MMENTGKPGENGSGKMEFEVEQMNEVQPQTIQFALANPHHMNNAKINHTEANPLGKALIKNEDWNAKQLIARNPGMYSAPARKLLTITLRRGENTTA